LFRNESCADGYIMIELQIQFQPALLCYVSESTELFEWAPVEGRRTGLAEFDIDCPSSDTSPVGALQIRSMVRW
jgi:hypothetical protein